MLVAHRRSQHPAPPGGFLPDPCRCVGSHGLVGKSASRSSSEKPLHQVVRKIAMTLPTHGKTIGPVPTELSPCRSYLLRESKPDPKMQLMSSAGLDFGGVFSARRSMQHVGVDCLPGKPRSHAQVSVTSRYVCIRYCQSETSLDSLAASYCTSLMAARCFAYTRSAWLRSLPFVVAGDIGLNLRFQPFRDTGLFGKSCYVHRLDHLIDSLAAYPGFAWSFQKSTQYISHVCLA